MDHLSTHAAKFKTHFVNVLGAFEEEMKRVEAAKITPPLKSTNVPTVVDFCTEKRDPHENIDIFITKTHKDWDRVKARDKDVILQILPGMVNVESMNPIIGGIVKIFIGPIVGYLKHRRTFEGDVFESKIWDNLDQMIIHSIHYIHHKRSPQVTGKYKDVYIKDFSVKTNATLWKVHTAWPGSVEKHTFDEKHGSEQKPSSEEKKEE